MNQPALIPHSPSSAAGSSLLSLWLWWTGELKMLLPPSIARWLDSDAVVTNVTVDAQAVTILAMSSGAAAPQQRVPLATLAGDPLVRSMIATGRDRVRLVLTPDQSLLKTIILPLATEENLREVVGFELDRHTPFTPDQAYYDVQVVRRDPQHEKIAVSLAVASKSDIAGLVATLRGAGLTCTAIGVGGSGSGPGNALPFDLQPAFDKPPRRLSRMHLINLSLLALAAMLMFVAVILPIWQKREAVKALIPQVTKSGAEFQISQRVYTEYTKLAAEYNFLAAKKHAVYPVISVLEELARTFPDTTWVQRLDIKANAKVREVTILGETQSASKVIENLEQSPLSLFQNSKHVTQTTRLQGTTERFHVSAEIKPRPVPAAESIDDVVTPTTIAPAPAPPPLAGSAPATTPTATVTTVPPSTAQPAPAAATDPMAAKVGPTTSATPASPTPGSSTAINGTPPTTVPPAKDSAQPKMPAPKRSGS